MIRLSGKVALRELAVGRPADLFLDYLVGAPAASGLFEREFGREGWMGPAVADALRRPVDRAALAFRLGDYLKGLGAPPESLEGAEALGRDGTVAVVTGQQPGLLGGPLLCLLKAVSAVRLAARIGTACGVKAVPVFWNASEDSDVSEADAVWWPAGGLRSAHASLPRDTPFCLSKPGEGWEPLLAWMAPLAAEAPFGREAVAIAERCSEGTVASSFSRFLLETAGSLGLVVVEPSLFAGEARALLERELADPRGSDAAIEAGRDRVRRLGYEPALTIAGRPRLFVLHRGRRVRIRPSLRKAGYTTGGARFLVASGEAMLAADVATRPILQDTVLPTAAYVGGPGEVAYLAVLRELYDRYAVRMPAIVPRHGATLLPPVIRRRLERLGLDGAALLRSGLPPGPPGAGELRAAFGRARSEAESAVDGLRGRVSAVDPSFVTMLDRTRGRVGEQLAGLERRVTERLSELAGLSSARLDEVAAAAMPRGGLQERTICAAWLLAHAGPGAAGELLAALPEEREFHAVLEIS